MLTVRALPCRIAALRSLLLIMRELPAARDRLEIINFFRESEFAPRARTPAAVAKHESCQRRRLLADAAQVVLQEFSKQFFLEHFLDPVLTLAKDPVWNIRQVLSEVPGKRPPCRLQICKLFSTVKQHLVYPADEVHISRMEKAVSELLAEDLSIYNRQILQQYGCDLSRAETLTSEARNQRLLEEERRLWTEAATAERAAEPKADSLLRVAKTPPPVPPKPKNSPLRRTCSETPAQQ